ncbi:hypothetical protein [Pseudomonas sp. AM8]|uniref:hypothetical protein n=1 Tax=Pseudomonas sp. AM8 TaxID=2983368 RepID=UPI002E80BBC2|nr:hypothetical protein [Pseudomonas sp. AM8]
MGSVLAGSAIALVAYVVLSVLGTAIGASAVSPTQIVDSYGQAYQQAMQKFEKLKQQVELKAREAGEVAAKQISRAAWSRSSHVDDRNYNLDMQWI